MNPVLPSLVLTLSHGNFQDTSMHFGALMAVYALMRFIGSSILGAFSDAYGRRPIILIALFGSATDYLIMALAPNLLWLYFGRCLSGLTAGMGATTYAYISDVTDNYTRAINYARLNAAISAGTIAGPLLGGFFTDLGLRAPFYVASWFLISNWFFCFLFLPESLQTPTKTFRLKSINPFSSIVGLYCARERRLLAAAYFSFNASAIVLFSVWILYSSLKYSFSPKQISFLFVVMGVSGVIAQTSVFKLVVNCRGEINTAIIGFLISIISLILFGVNPIGCLVYPIMAFWCFGGFVVPAVQSLIMKDISPTQAGFVQAGLLGVNALTGILFPNIAAWMLSHAANNGRDFALGFPFYFSAGLMLFGLIMMIMYKNRGILDSN